MESTQFIIKSTFTQASLQLQTNGDVFVLSSNQIAWYVNTYTYIECRPIIMRGAPRKKLAKNLFNKYKSEIATT